MKKIDERLDKIEDLLSKGSQMEVSENDFMNAKNASELLNFSLATLYTKICKREVPFYKQGNRLYFSRQELFDWIKEGRKKTLNDINADATKIVSAMNKKK
ncbi:helix-turn-helix domain-containing protein [Chryseobacterium chendengshani]|nr:helix-turn-helix domain-containing protein [Chryseobacterium sp. LJ668]